MNWLKYLANYDEMSLLDLFQISFNLSKCFLSDLALSS